MQMTRRIGEKVEEKMRHDAEQKEKNKDKVLDFSMYGMTQDDLTNRAKMVYRSTDRRDWSYFFAPWRWERDKRKRD